MTSGLVVVLYGRVVGRLARGAQGPTFRYDQGAGRVPISVNLPRSSHRVYPARRVGPFLEGLLPENVEARRRLARELETSEDSMSLLSVMGWDCPGAVQITDEDRLGDMMGRAGSLASMTDEEIGARLDRLSDLEASWTEPGEHWSLAGQQSKFALARASSGWAMATGSEPTTHILKPGIARLHHQALVEHATMCAASALGVDVATSVYTEFAGRPAIVITRFDRLISATGAVARVHQEDMCQAAGRMPERKYEENGGPSLRDMATILRANSRKPEPEIAKLADFLAINYAARAPDGHAKNVSIRILPSGDVRLAPLYDLASALPYEPRWLDSDLALSIGGRRRINDIHARQWTRAALDLQINEDQLRERTRHLVAGFSDAFRDALDEIGTPAAREVWARSADRVGDHAALCLTRLGERTGTGN